MDDRRTRTIGIFAARWRNLGCTIVTARNAEQARRRVVKSTWRSLSEWLEIDELSASDLVSVARLEIGVGPRRYLNAPTFCRVRMPGQTIMWTAPCGPAEPGTQWRQTGAAEPPSPASPSRIWSYVWQDRELVFFDAPDFESACERALSSASSWGFIPSTRRGDASADIEPVDRLEIQLRPPSLGGAPQCYWAWVEGVKVGWPTTAPEASSASAPVPPESPASPSAAHAPPPPDPLRRTG